MTKNKLNQRGNRVFQDRILIMCIAIGAMFCVLLLRFYKLQIIDHDKYDGDLRTSVERTVEIPATRGMIYDRYGKPLAVNKPVYVLKIDQQAVMPKKQLNVLLLKVINLLEENGDTYKDNIPISHTKPFTFTESETSVKAFITNSLPYNDKAHRTKLQSYSAEELFEYMRGEDVFQIGEDIADEDARKIIALRLEMYQLAYQKYKKVTLAENISAKTLSTIEENQADYPSILAEVDAKRYYPYGKEFGNVLGYTRMITASQYEELKNQDYDKDDIIGQMGIEQSMETELKGQKGQELIEVDNVGRKVFTLQKEDAKQGNNVFLTIDSDLQKTTYDAIERRLTEAIIQRMRGGLRSVKPLKGREIIVSMVANNQLNLKTMEKAPESQMQKQLYDKINNDYQARIKAIEAEKNKNEETEEEQKLPTLKEHFMELLEAEPSTITNREILLALCEQGSLKLDENLVQRIWNNSYPGLEGILINELEAGRLKPDQMSINPFSATAVVIDVHTGEVLTMVGYPSYDSNEMTNNFNSYYTMLHDGIDGRNLLWNRAIRTADAPGSTFKMISALAGLEEGVVTPSTQIYDTGTYTKAGKPYPKCWIQTTSGHGHGNVNIYRALEVSCNFYFYDLAYRLGLKNNLPYGGINTLSKYAEMFGLGETTGIELPETEPNISNPTNIVNSNVNKAINTITNMSDERKKLIRTRIRETMDNGFYPYGSSRATDVEGRIDYLTQYETKKMIDNSLEEVLNDNIEVIWDKMLDDFQKQLRTNEKQIIKELVDTILNDGDDYSLKSKAKYYINETLLKMITPSTDKLITKSINKLSKEEVDSIYRTVYTNAIRRNEGKESEVQYVVEMKKRIEAIDNGTFDSTTKVIEKVKERLMDILLDYLFERVEMEWTTAITIRTAIGQGNNAFTPLQMARYIAGLANGKEVYDLRVVSGIYDNKEKEEYAAKPAKIFNELDLKESNLKAVYQGMYQVAKGTEGTARTYFRDFPINVAVKTGTAQKGADENAWFVGFAPYENPQIAIVTSIYGADGLGMYNTQLAKDILTAFFALDNDIDSVTLDNKFVE